MDVWSGHMLNIITPSDKRRIERATVVGEVEIFDRCFLLEVIIWGNEFLTLFVGEARPDLKAYASIGDELKCAEFAFALAFIRDDAPNALELAVEKGFALLKIHRRAFLCALWHIGTEDALEHLAFELLLEIFFVAFVEFNAGLADRPRNHFYADASRFLDDLLKQEHSREGVILRLNDIERIETDMFCVFTGQNAIHAHGGIDLLEAHAVAI